MIRLSFGNHKLGNDTCIFNMSTAAECPSRLKNLCPLYNGQYNSILGAIKIVRCYAEKAELQYKENCLNYRNQQRDYWQKTDAGNIVHDLLQKIQRRKKETRYFRFNESGDFNSQKDIEKLSVVADSLKLLNITTYGYTARSDLDYTNIRFLVKGSGFNKPGLNGMTTLIGHSKPAPSGFIKCPGGRQACSKCNLCKINVPHNIAFEIH